MGCAVSPAPRRMIVVMPAWNEAERLDEPRVVAFLAGHPEVGILFVDDGSTDGTPRLLERIRSLHPDQVELMVLGANMGKGEAVRRGLVQALEAGCEVAGYLDSDLAAPLDTMLLLEGELRANPALHLVLGSRVKLLGWNISRSELRHYLGRVFATFASLTLDLPVYDTQCGAKLMRNTSEVRAAMVQPFLSRWLFDVELIARLRDAAGVAALREVPVSAWADTGGSSVRLRDFLKAPWELFRIRRRYPPQPRRPDPVP